MEEEKIPEPIEKPGKFSWLRIAKMVLIVVLIIGAAAGLGVAAVSRPVRIAWASWVLDNHENYLGCYDLPFFPQVEKALSRHADVAEKLKQLGAYRVSAEKISCKGWDEGIELTKGDILIQYNTHAQRLAIEKQIGDNFFGIPYRGENH